MLHRIGYRGVPMTDVEVLSAHTAAATATTATAGDLIDGCAIDLPKNDVVEAIEFERFFVLNVRYQDLQRPATLMTALLADSTGISEDEISATAPMFAAGAPFSRDERAWRRHAEPSATRGRASSESAMEAHAQASLATPNIAGSRLAFYLPYRQEWALDGYSRGRMVNSMTLGPEEEQTVEIFTWDRATRSLDSSTSFEMEQTNESSGTRRDTTDIAKEVGRQSGFELTSDAKVGFKVEVVNADLSAGTSAKTALNDSEKDARQSIVEATSRAATQVRSSRTLKVVETREWGQETRVTRKVRNHNTCHTLTTAFFEVLANYTVSTKLQTGAIRLVVLLRSDELSNLKEFDRRSVRSHERTLSLALLDSTLLPGFAAARYLESRDRACAILCRGCECGPDMGVEARDQEWEALVTALQNLGAVVTALRSYTVMFPLSVALARAEIPPGSGPGTADIRRHMFMRSLAAHAPRLLTDLGGLMLATTAITPAAADSAMTIIGAVAPEDLAALGGDAKVSSDEWWLIFAAILAVTPAPDPVTQFVMVSIATGALVGAIGGLAAFNDGGFVAAVNDVRAKYEAWQTYLADKRKDDAKLAELARIASEERAMRVLDAFPLRETADAEERLEALLDHLNDPRNLDHYRFAVWNERAGGTDPQLLALALAGITAGAPVGVVGDELAVPVHLAAGSSLTTFFDESIEDLLTASPSTEAEHILPTAALYAEAIPGECCACEQTIVRNEELDLHRKELDNELVQLEADRLTARLGADKLDGPSHGQPIQIEVTSSSGNGSSGPTP